MRQYQHKSNKTQAHRNNTQQSKHMCHTHKFKNHEHTQFDNDTKKRGATKPKHAKQNNTSKHRRGYNNNKPKRTKSQKG